MGVECTNSCPNCDAMTVEVARLRSNLIAEGEDKARLAAEVEQRRRAEATELAVVLDEIEEYLDNRSDCEGNGPADARPNVEMRLLCALRDAREKASGR